MVSVLNEIWQILNESAVYLLLGFALAGLLHVALRRTPRFTNLLAARGGKSVALAALFGVPLPLCSCSVVPAALTLRKRGASKGATVSFLISVPETDIVSILLTYGLLGGVMAVFRPFAAVVVAMVAGMLTNVVDRWVARDEDLAAADEEPCCKEDDEEYNAEKGTLWNAFHYGFVRFFDDIIGPLILGVVLGGLITAILPRLGLEQLAGGSVISMLAMLVIGIPMYVCATASTPIAAGLIIGGISPGAALVFLLAGPATNIGSLLVLAKHLGRSALISYLCAIAVVSILMGLWFDAAFDVSSISPLVPAATAAAAGYAPVKITGSILLLLLAYMSFRRSGAWTFVLQRISRATGLRLEPRRVMLGCLICLLIAYACSGLFIVDPGERAVVTRFGRITQTNLMPGLHYRWPYPIGRTDIESVTKVKRIELGFRGSPQQTEDTTTSSAANGYVLTSESWMLTGHEDIIDIKWVAQYQVMDSEDGRQLENYLFGIGDPQTLVRSAADSAIRVAVGRRGIDTLLTTERRDVEVAVEESLQAALDECRAGIRVIHVGLLDVHAPEEVHWAFRDVASASEDKMKTINKAQEYEERVVPEAIGGRQKRVLAARGKATELKENALGKSAAFTARLTAYRENRTITRLRLYFESMDAVLPGLKKYVCLSSVLSDGIDLWLIKKEKGALELPMLPPTDRRPRR